MESDFSRLRELLEQFRETLEFDYAAVARVDERDNQIRYECVTGNHTNRHVQMVKRPGSGIAGHVVRHGRPVIIDETRDDLAELKVRYPIMLAEKLEAVLAVPIFHGDLVGGVLLGAVRRKRTFASGEVTRAEQAAAAMSDVLRQAALQP